VVGFTEWRREEKGREGKGKERDWTPHFCKQIAAIG